MLLQAQHPTRHHQNVIPRLARRAPEFARSDDEASYTGGHRTGDSVIELDAYGYVHRREIGNPW
jgi:hypothetical protein